MKPTKISKSILFTHMQKKRCIYFFQSEQFIAYFYSNTYKYAYRHYDSEENN